MKRAKTLSFIRLTSIFSIVVSLLFTQFVGERHRIEHAQWQHSGLLKVATSQYGPSDKHHSCIDFDASTLADAIGTAIIIALLAAGTHVLAQWLAFISWQAPVKRYFLSRAPPR
jgi:hypothetical protein